MWHSSTFRMVTTLNFDMGRVWTLAVLKRSNDVAIGFDDGSMIIKVSTFVTTGSSRTWTVLVLVSCVKGKVFLAAAIARGGVVALRTTPGEEVPGSIPAVAARSPLVGSVSV